MQGRCVPEQCAPKRKVSDVPSLGHVVPDQYALTLDCIEVPVKTSLMYAYTDKKEEEKIPHI